MTWAIEFDGVNDSMSFASAITLVGDFNISFDSKYDTTARIYIGNGSSTATSFIACLTGGEIRFKIAGTDYSFVGFAVSALDDITVDISRVGSTLTTDVNGEVKVLLGVSTSDVTFTTIGGLSAFPIIGQTTFMKIGSANHYSATASSHAAGTPVLVDTISGNDATGVNMPTDGSAWIDLGGGVTVTPNYYQILMAGN